MTLAASRIVEIGETPYPHEREAIDFAVRELPNHDPYHLWALLDLLDPSTGRLYEIDLLVLGYSALYLVEVKSGPGLYQGDYADWWRTPPGKGERPRYLEAPLRLANHKAKVLKSRLRAAMSDPKRAPRVEALIFLSHEDVNLQLTAAGDTAVVTRQNFVRAITHHEFVGSPPGWRARRIDRPTAKDISQGLKALGLRKRKGKAMAGPYELGAVVAEGPGFQDRAAKHGSTESIRSRARTYLVPQQTSIELRQQLRRAADREALILHEVREHGHVLRSTGYFPDAPLGPTVVFDDFDGGLPLGAFLRQNPELPFIDRVELLEQVARALGHCHRKSVVHGALSPDAVLVRRHPTTGAIDARLFNFQLGASAQASATTHWSALASEPCALYQAPELREDPSARAPVSDLFSLGALAYLVLTGRPPGETQAEVLLRLAQHSHLDPRTVSNRLPEPVADLICLSTALAPLNRIDDADDWAELLLEHATSPEPVEAGTPIDPLEARAEDILEGSLLVRSVLGHGATSRVLLVEREQDHRELALKVAISPEHHQRLDREAEVLAKLKHPRIVSLVEPCTIADRRCLLLSLAGSDTLARHLTKEGTLSLDLACRYGEDLLQALEHLEEAQVMHRDLKPANLGVGTATKKGLHLTLFDFSLAFAPQSDLNVGTAVYRDPFLELRGAWDYAAERWSAAVTLHEMLTGLRASFGNGRPAIDSESKLTLAAERFDPSARARLVSFFERALHRDADQRFESATQMRHAWIACFELGTEPVAQPSAGASADPNAAAEPAGHADLSDEALAAIEPSTPIEALPLSLRARNALDRSGVIQAADLLTLADNRLSAMRGIGTKVAKEILVFRTRWQAVRAIEAPEVRPFFPGYQGADLMVAAVGLDAPIVEVLRDAGLHSLAAIASARQGQIATLAKRHRFTEKALRTVLTAEHQRTLEQAAPSSLASLLDLLLPKTRKTSRYFRALYGLAPPFEGRLDVTVREVAEHFDVTQPAIYVPLQSFREAWQQRPTLLDHRDGCHRIVEHAGGALRIDRMATELLSALPGDGSASDPLQQARAAAVIRAICEIDRDDPEGLRLVRLRDETPWVLAREELAPVVRALGAAADELAEREVLASPGEVERVLSEVAKGTALSELGAERLSQLAASASKKAARSPRLEIYPRGMSATRSLELSSAMLVTDLGPAQLSDRVSARYPDAEPLPERPELDTLLRAHGLLWNPQKRRYERPGDEPGASLHTQFSSATSLSATLRLGLPLPEPMVIATRDFDERIQATLEQRSLRVLGVTADRAEVAALGLARRFGLETVSLDAALVAEMREQMKVLKIPSDQVIHDADREGPTGKAWPNLLMLVKKAADALAERLLPPQEPLLLVQPGLIARYELTSLLSAIIAASKQDESEAIFLLIPGHDTGGIPKVNGELVITGILPSQATWIPRPWLSRQESESAA